MKIAKMHSYPISRRSVENSIRSKNLANDTGEASVGYMKELNGGRVETPTSDRN